MPPGRRNNCSQQLILVAVDLLAYAANVNRTTRESSVAPPMPSLATGPRYTQYTVRED